MVMRPAASRVNTAGGSGGGGPWMTTGRSVPANPAGGCAAAGCAATHGSARASSSHQRPDAGDGDAHGRVRDGTGTSVASRFFH